MAEGVLLPHGSRPAARLVLLRSLLLDTAAGHKLRMLQPCHASFWRVCSPTTSMHAIWRLVMACPVLQRTPKLDAMDTPAGRNKTSLVKSCSFCTHPKLTYITLNAFQMSFLVSATQVQALCHQACTFLRAYIQTTNVRASHATSHAGASVSAQLAVCSSRGRALSTCHCLFVDSAQAWVVDPMPRQTHTT